jgi:hypothetical protein
MITYTTNQRRSLRMNESGNWVEEVLAASGVKVDSSGFTTVTGLDVQELLDNVDNVLDGNLNATATGIVMITDVSTVSGSVGEVLDNIDVVTLPSGLDSSFRFSFCVPAQPTQPVKIQMATIPRGSGVAGTLKLKMSYNLFESGDDATVGGFGASLTPITQSIIASEYEKIKLLNFSIPTSQFSSSGSAPFLVNCKIERDTSVSGNYGADVSIAQMFADNVPGGIIGNIAGYTGGNLVVTGDLTVSGNFILAGSIARPAASGSAGISGSVVIDDDFMYACVADNKWKRINISSF